MTAKVTLTAEALAARIVAAHPRRPSLRSDNSGRWSFGWPNFAALAGFIVGWTDFGIGPSLAADTETEAELQELFTPTSVLEDTL